MSENTWLLRKEVALQGARTFYRIHHHITTGADLPDPRRLPAGVVDHNHRTGETTVE